MHLISSECLQRQFALSITALHERRFRQQRLQQRNHKSATHLLQLRTQSLPPADQSLHANPITPQLPPLPLFQFQRRRHHRNPSHPSKPHPHGTHHAKPHRLLPLLAIPAPRGPDVHPRPRVPAGRVSNAELAERDAMDWAGAKTKFATVQRQDYSTSGRDDYFR